jgi:elongator complex protein 6
MATRQTLPPLLEPYLTSLSSSTTAGGSLVLLTSVLGTSTNWLVLRYLQVLLRDRQQPHHGSSPPPGGGVTVGRIGDDPGQQQEGEGGEGEEEAETAVLLVSFLRDFAFWREGMARLGVDLEAAGRKGRFGFVDGLCGLLFGGSSPSPPSLPASAPRGQAQQQQQQQDWKRTLTSPKPGDVLRVVLEGVEGLKIAAQQPLQQAASAAAAAAAAVAAARVPGNGGRIGVVGSSSRKKKQVVLIVDGLDFLLAASPPPPPLPSNTPTETPLAVTLKDMVMDWREVRIT